MPSITVEYATFSALVDRSDAAMVPVCRELLSDTLTPTAAFLRLRRRGEPAFLLESVEGGERIGRYSFLGTRPFRAIRAWGPRIEIAGAEGEPVVREEGNFFAVLERELRAYRSPAVLGLPPFAGGAVGYISYDAVRYVERIPDAHPREDELPDALFHFYDAVIAFDRALHRLLLIANVLVARGKESNAQERRRAFAAAQERLDALEASLRGPADDTVLTTLAPLAPRSILDGMRSNVSRGEFEAAVVRAKEYITQGDVFQVVLSQRFECEAAVDPFEVYRTLRALNPSPYLFFLEWEETALLGSSPEILVRVEGSRVVVRPIAGTRPRGATREEDLALERDLLADEKELAEHRMLVDLGRNDIGRVARFGSVKLLKLLTVERYSHVMHIVSEVEGELQDGLSSLDAFQAGFPAGTLSGAPKIRAMEIIDELEPTRRGIYGGAVGYMDFAGNLDTCIAIRTLLFHRGRARLQAGAGIVADSVPEREYMETVHKATALFEAIRRVEARVDTGSDRQRGRT